MYKAIDLFAGAGGLSTGLEMAGFKVVYANEISAAYAETLRQNHPESTVDVRDIRAIEPSVILDDLSLKPGDLDLLAGGPPCQGFSINAPIRSSEDERNHLFWKFLGFVEAAKPKIVLIENVPGMISFAKGDVVKSILKVLTDYGYDCSVRILYAAHYGIPQMRWRTIFIANRLGMNSSMLYPKPTHSAKAHANFRQTFAGMKLVLPHVDVMRLAKQDPVTVEDAIGDLPEIPNGGGEERQEYNGPSQNGFQRTLRANSKSIFNHRCAGLGKANLVRLPHIPPGGSWRDIPFDLLPEGMKRARRSDHTKRYGRLDPTGIASTILTKCDPHWGTFIHPYQDRVLSVREAARIQSFPDRVVFQGSLSEQYAQVGNAVPPLFAKALGVSIKTALEQSDFDVSMIDNGYTAKQANLAF